MVDNNTQNPFALHASVAYVAQQAWLLNDTIRGNITFGLPYDDKRYNEVIKMCALSRDLEVLDAGDMTQVGEQGVVLSGGQKQRICLARAVYSPARNVIMDDCLSAVDTHTAKHLYENCLMSSLMAERTRILVTHAVGLTVKGASTVVVMHNGRIAAAGTYAEVLRSGKLSEEIMCEANAQLQIETSQSLSDAAVTDNNPKQQQPVDAAISARFDGDNGRTTPDGDVPRVSSDSDTQQGTLTNAEEWSRGHVRWNVYTEYINASGGVVVWLLLMVLFMIQQGLQVVQDWWLKEWAASYGKSSDDDINGSGIMPSLLSLEQ
ncbi:hypothetical protein H4R20_006510, partial [Coemansia guatemalensis]